MVLTSAAWRTADATGELAYMKYEEVQKYADVYDVQEKMNRLQERLVENVIISLPAQEPETYRDSELERWKQQVSASSHTGTRSSKSARV